MTSRDQLPKLADWATIIGLPFTVVGTLAGIVGTLIGLVGTWLAVLTYYEIRPVTAGTSPLKPPAENHNPGPEKTYPPFVELPAPVRYQHEMKAGIPVKIIPVGQSALTKGSPDTPLWTRPEV